MRLLFAFVGGVGHLAPLVPIAQAAAKAGHQVLFGCSPSMRAAVAAVGFDACDIGPRTSVGARRRLALRAVDRDREERDLRERFVLGAARFRTPFIVDVCEAWKPDVIVCDETDFGSMVAAERLGIPHASIQVIASGSFVRKDVIGDALDEVRRENGLSPDQDLEMLSRYLVLSPFPPSFRDPAFPPRQTVHPIRPPLPRAASPGDHSPPELPEAPIVYCTLGTIFNSESGDLLSILVEGLRALDRNLVVTVGRERDPAELGPQPPHVRVERFIPQSEILPLCELVVSHGGSGSVVGALSHGLPSLLIPLGADQPLNGDRCAELGVARVIDAISVTAAIVRDEAARVVAEPSFRIAAERLRDEIASLPEAGAAISLLERLAAEGAPVLREDRPSHR